ncbi:MAG: AsmA family protein [Syntrophales bacterium]
MFRKLLIAIGALIAFIALLVIIAGVVIIMKVDKGFIESRMAKDLSRQVNIEKIDVGIFSVVSGMEVKNVNISNFKPARELDSLQGKPVAPNDIFAGIKSIRVKVQLLPLFWKQFVLKELIFDAPIINLSRSRNGVLNCDDLIKSGKEQPEQTEKTRNAAADPSRPVTADSIPLAVTAGRIGVTNGTINYHDGESDQKFEVYNLTAMAYDIRIDARDLEKSDEIMLKMSLGLKTVGPMKTGSVQNFDIDFDAEGKIKPFDVKTRELDPEITLHAGFPDGQITGLQIFTMIAAIPILGDYLGEQVSFLRGRQEWKDSRESYVDLHYKAHNIQLTNGQLNMKEAKLLFSGTANTESKLVNANLNMVLKKEINSAVKASLAKKVEMAIRNPEVKKYADPNKLAEAAMQPLLNNEGMIYMTFNVNGTIRKPDVKLVQPQLASLDTIITKAAGNILLEAGKSASKAFVGEGQKKLLEIVPDLFKK